MKTPMYASQKALVLHGQEGFSPKSSERTTPHWSKNMSVCALWWLSMCVPCTAREPLCSVCSPWCIINHRRPHHDDCQNKWKHQSPHDTSKMMAAKKQNKKPRHLVVGTKLGPTGGAFTGGLRNLGSTLLKWMLIKIFLQNAFKQKNSHLPASPLPATSFPFPSTFSFPPLFSFPAAGLIIKKEIIKVLCHVCVFWLTTAAKALSWWCHSHIRSIPMVFFLVGPLKVQKKCQQQWP